MGRGSDQHGTGADPPPGSGQPRPGEKMIARRPEGPPHPRTASIAATLKRAFYEFKEDQGTIWAAALTYFGLLSLFPALLAIVSLAGLFTSPQQVTGALTSIAGHIGPGSAVQALKGPLTSITGNAAAGGVLAFAGLAGALWSASGYIGAFTRASNVIWEVEEGRPFFLLRSMQLAVTFVQAVLIALVALAVVVSGPVASAVGSALGAGSAAVTAWNIAKWPVIVITVAACIALLYYATPNARQRGFLSVLPGTALALVIWLIASAGFGLYVAYFGSYNKTYGSLGGIIIFLVWLWITNNAIVLGTGYNAERERSRQIAAQVAGAERELQVPLRREPKPAKRSRTG